jgi:hypothetical protein
MNIEDSLLVEVATLELVINKLQARSKVVRAAIAAELRPGNRVDAVSPLDKSMNLGLILMTKPDTQAWVSNRTEFAEWVRKTYPDKVRNDFKVIASAAEVISALYLHKREYLGDEPVVDKEFEADVLARSRDRGEAAGPSDELDVPGITVNTPKSVLRCTPDPQGPAAVAQMLSSGKLSILSLLLDEPAVAAVPK